VAKTDFGEKLMDNKFIEYEYGAPKVIGSLDYKDVYIIPQYSEIESRSQVDTSIVLRDGFKLTTPVISANMDSVTGPEMTCAMFNGGGTSALHRFMSIDENINQFKKSVVCFVSVGVNEESKERAKALYDAGARRFIIDIAHGHSLQMKKMLTWMKENFKNNLLVAGNVATPEAVADLASWGAHIVKVGIGPGGACLTKNVTGVTFPQFSAVQGCAMAAENHDVQIIADGGISEIGDIAKALGIGADMVMCGRLFSSCKEAPGERIAGKKVYRGMASRDAMLTIRKDDGNLPTPEGLSTLIEDTGISATQICADIKGGLQSAFSYSNSRTLKEYQTRCKFGIRKTEMK